MMDKPKIHIFLGAPTPPHETATSTEQDGGRWETLDLCLHGVRLRPKGRGQGAQGSDMSPVGRVSDEQDLILPNEGLDRLTFNPDAARDKDAPASGTEEERANVTWSNADSEERITSRRKRATCDEQGLCPGTVKEYLDSCFPALEPGPGAEPAGAEAPPRLSLEAEYLSAWTMSQTLLLKGRLGPQAGPGPESAPEKCVPTASGSTPDLYSPASSPTEREAQGPREGSQELFDTLSERQEEGGVVLEATSEGVLCSQGSPTTGKGRAAEEGGSLWVPPRPSSAFETSSATPSSKKSKVSPVRAEGGAAQTRVPPQGGPTTLLGRCVARGVRYSVLVAVVFPCHLKEIKIKSGNWAGSTVPLATIVVTDQSGVDMKVVLWRTAAFWALTVNPGDLLLITGVMLNEDKWRGEMVLQSSYTSRLLNLGQLTSNLQPPVPQNVNGWTMGELWGHLCKKHPLLLSLPRRTPQNPHAIPYVRLRALQPDTLVHALLRVTHTSMTTAWRAEAESCSRSGRVQKAMLSVEQGDGQQGVLVLWGSAMAWLQRIHRNQGAVWEFRVLLVKREVTAGHLELHSTPWGSCEPLFHEDRRAVEFRSWAQPEPPHTSFEIDLRTLLSQKYSGDVEFKGQITAFQFQGGASQNASLLMNGETPSQEILETVSGDVTFTGCGRCGTELDTDDNGIYRPCYPCLPHTSVRRYYRPAVLMVRDGGSEACVQVPPALVQKILLNTPPDKLSKTVAPSSDVRFAQVVADRLNSLLSIPPTAFLLTVRSHFLCDENNIPTAQDFFMLDIHP